MGSSAFCLHVSYVCFLNKNVADLLGWFNLYFCLQAVEWCYNYRPYKTLKVVCEVHLIVLLKMRTEVQRREMSTLCLGLLVTETTFFLLQYFYCIFLSYFSCCRTGTSSGIVSSSPQMVWRSFTCLFIIKTTQTHCSNQ